ncbi:RNA methyltransferase, TrmH family, group 3, partial [human gut metagenome]
MSELNAVMPNLTGGLAQYMLAGLGPVATIIAMLGGYIIANIFAAPAEGAMFANVMNDFLGNGIPPAVWSVSLTVILVDPHNLGAIIRTANLAGAHGVIIPKHRAVGITPTVAKTSAGAINYTPVVKVTNIGKTMDELKERGMWFACADMDGEVIYRQNLTGSIGLVIGNEGSGVSRLVKEKCDFISS